MKKTLQLCGRSFVVMFVAKLTIDKVSENLSESFVKVDCEDWAARR